MDEKIELNRRTSATLEQMAQALFRSWFINFDPVKAKAAGKRPKNLAPEIFRLFPKEFEDSPLGPVPKGWTVGCVGEEFHLTMGQSPPGSTYNEDGEGIAFYQGKTDFGFRFPTQRMFCTAPTRFANPGDSLVSVRAPVGSVNISTEKCCIGRGLAAVRHRSESRSYTYYFLRSKEDIFQRFEAEGTVFGSINKVGFQGIICIVPTPEIINAFENLVYPLDERIQTNDRESRTLSTLRDTLLPKLMSGEVEV